MIGVIIMMGKRSVVLTVITLIMLTCTVASAIDVELQPDYIYIEPGGYNSTTMIVKLKWGEVPGWIKLGYKIEKYAEYLDARLKDPITGIPLTKWGDKGIAYMVAFFPGTYYFILEFRATENLPSTGVGLAIAGGKSDVNIDTDTVTIYPIPEVSTMALLGVGLVALMLVKRRFS